MELEVKIRDLIKSDAQDFEDAFSEQGWNKKAEQYENYYKEQTKGKRVVVVATVNDKVAGYLTILPSVSEGAYANMGIPEICDFNVLQKFQKIGIGNKLMNHAEAYVAKTHDTITLGVGLHSGYGAAQRIYVKRGYIPHGSGAWYQGKILEQYVPCVNDDDLIIYMSKSLK